MKKELFATMLLATASTPALADVTGDLRHIQTNNQNTTYQELELWTSFGGENGVDYYLWLDRYNGNELYGESIFTSKQSVTIGGLDWKVRGQVTHNTLFANSFGYEYGLGVQTDLPFSKDSSCFGNVAISPFWLDQDGHNIDRVRADFFVSCELPLESRIHAFGDVDHEGGNTHIPFAQAGLTKPVYKKLSAGVGYNFLGEGDMSPKPELYAELKLNFEF